jgi:putative peptidoglycan lipid II flippase
VGSGILLSRILGLLRERIFAHYFGNTDAADAFKAALKIPNLLQNLFGEGVLSSSFIPVYANLLSSGDREEANRAARAIGSLLTVVVSLLVLAGVLATPILIDLIAPGFEGPKRLATIRMVRIMFPGMGILVLSALCLGILNSHRRFFLPYAAPILWNLSMIGALVGFGGRHQSYDLAEIVAWASVAGSILQLGVQIPSVLRLAGRIRFRFDAVSSNVRTIIRNFIPGVAGRGVNQLSSYIDVTLASLLATEGAVAALAYTQTIYLLPVSLFGMSISNAELPEMASHTGTGESAAEALRERLNRAMTRVAFFVVPSTVVFLALGDSVIAFLYQTGKFTRDNAQYVWEALAGYTVGLQAATLGRLYTSAFWALRDTRTPFRFASIRVALAAGLGWCLAFPVSKSLGLPPQMGLAGLTLAAGVGAWVEISLLRYAMNRRIGKTGLPASLIARLWTAAVIAAIPAFAVKYEAGTDHPLIAGSLVLSIYGLIYFGAAALLKIPEATQLLWVLRSRFGGRG